MSRLDSLEWCSLCGLHFTTERALKEHRHAIDDCDDDNDNTGERVQLLAAALTPDALAGEVQP